MSGFYPTQVPPPLDEGMNGQLTCSPSLGYTLRSTSMTTPYPMMMDFAGYRSEGSVSPAWFYPSQSQRQYPNSYMAPSHVVPFSQGNVSLIAPSRLLYPEYRPGTSFQIHEVQHEEYDKSLHHASDDSYSTQSSTHCTASPARSQDLEEIGILDPLTETWSCRYPGCTSKSVFRRACDLRKHYNRHRKHLFCRFKGCPQATEGGFSSKKDRTRHEGKHNPQIPCEYAGCGRVFSRVDNMKDHVRRIHARGGR